MIFSLTWNVALFGIVTRNKNSQIIPVRPGRRWKASSRCLRTPARHMICTGWLFWWISYEIWHGVHIYLYVYIYIYVFWKQDDMYVCMYINIYVYTFYNREYDNGAHEKNPNHGKSENDEKLNTRCTTKTSWISPINILSHGVTTDLSVLSHRCHCWIGPAWNIRNTPPRGHTWHTWVPKKYKSYIDDQNIWVPGSWNLTHSHISPIWNVGECCYAVLSFNPAVLKNPSNQCVLVYQVRWAWSKLRSQMKQDSKRNSTWRRDARRNLRACKI